MIEPGSQTVHDELRSRGSARGQRARVRRRHPNHRLVKIHRTYTVEDIAGLFGTHKNTVRQWIRAGLPTIDDGRPMLILGPQLIA